MNTEQMAILIPQGSTGWIGLGPFQAKAAPPGGGSAFYINDFQLSDPRPWKIPARLHRVEPGQGMPSWLTEGEAFPPLRVRWQPTDEDEFQAVFRRIRNAIRHGKMEKMVPSQAQNGEVLQGSPRSLVQRLFQLAAPLHAYGWLNGGNGFAGATPEIFLEKDSNQLRCMALAGTARGAGQDAGFSADPKEAHEHELVAQWIIGQCQALGEVTARPRQVLTVGALQHLLTLIDVRLTGPEQPSITELIRMLHPTPAMGVYPRDAGLLQQLQLHRQRLKVPPHFGAPFGLWHEGRFVSVAAIRGLFWREKLMQLPSGCGVVGESVFDHEWRELRRKREAVRSVFGV